VSVGNGPDGFRPDACDCAVDRERLCTVSGWEPRVYVTNPPDPVRVVAFNYTSDGKPPFITYEIPVAQGGSFTAPWLMLTNEAGGIIGDTVILLTNPDSVATLSIDVMLRGTDGVLEPGCTKQIALGPKATLKRSTRLLFSTCPLIP
jgi:hypothetical protein